MIGITTVVLLVGFVAVALILSTRHDHTVVSPDESLSAYNERRYINEMARHALSVHQSRYPLDD